MTLTDRGRFVVGCLALIGFVLLLGFAGWIEGGCN